MNYKHENLINKKKIYFCTTFCLLFTIICLVLILNPNLLNEKKNLIKNYSDQFNKINSALTPDNLSFNLNKNLYKNRLNNSIVDLDLLAKKISYIHCESNDDTSKVQQLLTSIDNTKALLNNYLYFLENDIKITDSDIAEINILKDTCNTSFQTLKIYQINVTFSDENILYFENLDNYLKNSTEADSSNDEILDSSLVLNDNSTISKDDFSSFSKAIDFFLSSDGINKISNLFN